MTNRDKFSLYDIFLQQKINLPSLVLNHWMDCAKERVFTKVAARNFIPYAMLFLEILKIHNLEKNLNLERLEANYVGEEITRATINKMHITDKLLPLVKEEPIDDVCSNPRVNPNSPFTAMMKEKK